MDLLDLDGIDRVFVQSRKVPIRHPACLPEPVLRTAPHAGFRASRTLTGNRRLGTAKPVWPGHYSSAHETCPVPSLLHEYVDGATHTEPRYRFRAGADLESCLLTLHSDPECDVAGFSRQRDFPLVHSQPRLMQHRGLLARRVRGHEQPNPLVNILIFMDNANRHGRCGAQGGGCVANPAGAASNQRLHALQPRLAAAESV